VIISNISIGSMRNRLFIQIGIDILSSFWVKKKEGRGRRRSQKEKRLSVTFSLYLRSYVFVGSGHRSNFPDGRTAYDYIP